jgi:hypothetical protein
MIRSSVTAPALALLVFAAPLRAAAAAAVGIVSPCIGRSATAAQWVHADVESACSVNPRLIGAALAEAQHFHHWRLL